MAELRRTSQLARMSKQRDVLRKNSCCRLCVEGRIGSQPANSRILRDGRGVPLTREIGVGGQATERDIYLRYHNRVVNKYEELIQKLEVTSETQDSKTGGRSALA